MQGPSADCIRENWKNWLSGRARIKACCVLQQCAEINKCINSLNPKEDTSEYGSTYAIQDKRVTIECSERACESEAVHLAVLYAFLLLYKCRYVDCKRENWEHLNESVSGLCVYKLGVCQQLSLLYNYSIHCRKSKRVQDKSFLPILLEALIYNRTYPASNNYAFLLVGIRHTPT